MTTQSSDGQVSDASHDENAASVSGDTMPTAATESTTAAQAINAENWRVLKEECDRTYVKLTIAEQKEFCRAMTEAHRKFKRDALKRKAMVLTTIPEAFAAGKSRRTKNSSGTEP